MCLSSCGSIVRNLCRKHFLPRHRALPCTLKVEELCGVFVKTVALSLAAAQGLVTAAAIHQDKWWRVSGIQAAATMLRMLRSKQCKWSLNVATVSSDCHSVKH